MALTWCCGYYSRLWWRRRASWNSLQVAWPRRIPIWLTVRNVVGAAAAVGVSAVKLCEVLEALMVAHI